MYERGSISLYLGPRRHFPKTSTIILGFNRLEFYTYSRLTRTIFVHSVTFRSSEETDQYLPLQSLLWDRPDLLRCLWVRDSSGVPGTPFLIPSEILDFHQRSTVGRSFAPGLGCWCSFIVKGCYLRESSLGTRVVLLVSGLVVKLKSTHISIRLLGRYDVT